MRVRVFGLIITGALALGLLAVPFAGTIHFKWLMRGPSSEMEPFLADPPG